MPRAGSVRCCAYHSCLKRSDKKRSFGHVYPVVPTQVQRHPQLFKAEHDGVLCNQHGCKLAAISGGRVEADNTLGGEVVEIDSPPSPLSLSSSPSPALVQLASAALQPFPRRPNDSCGDRALCTLDTASEGGAVDDDDVDLLRHTSSLHFSLSSLLSSSSPPPLTSSPPSSLSSSSSPSVSRALSLPPLIDWSNQYDRLHPITEQLEAVYALYTKYCSPMHGPDKDVGNLPEKRARTQRPLDPTSRAVMPLTDACVPRTVALGYAECRRGSFDHVCRLLCNETPRRVSLASSSTLSASVSRLRRRWTKREAVGNVSCHIAMYAWYALTDFRQGEDRHENRCDASRPTPPMSPTLSSPTAPACRDVTHTAMYAVING